MLFWSPSIGSLFANWYFSFKLTFVKWAVNNCFKNYCLNFYVLSIFFHMISAKLQIYIIIDHFKKFGSNNSLFFIKYTFMGTYGSIQGFKKEYKNSDHISYPWVSILVILVYKRTSCSETQKNIKTFIKVCWFVPIWVHNMSIGGTPPTDN